MRILRKTIIISSFLMVFSLSNAQKFEMGKVTIAELEERKHPKDSSAVAAILFQKGQTSFNFSDQKGFSMQTKVQTRIKIYKKEGYDWANHIESYYVDGDSRESISFYDVYTYNLEGGKIVKTKLKSDGEFTEKINKYWNNKKITLPNVKEGSVVEFEYVINSPNITSLKDWEFQKAIPVNYSEFKTLIPEYFVYNSNQKGFFSPKVTVEKNARSITLTSKQLGAKAVVSDVTTEKIDYTEVRTQYVLEEIPALKDESFVNNIQNYASSITHELSYIQYPNSLPKYFTTDWATVTKNIYDNESFGLELNKSGYFEQDITNLLAGLTNQNEKIAAIFNFVKQSVTWNGFNGYYCNEGVRKAYKDKSGNAAEINLMLTAMLRYAGINANPVLLSTRSNGIALFPSRAAFNYVIAAIETPEGNILLDATEKYSLPNILPVRDLNWQGRLIRKDGTSTSIELMPNKISKMSLNMVCSLDTKGGITGKLKKNDFDQVALSFRQRYAGIKEESYLESLENENNKIEISDYLRENENDLSKPVIESYSFKSDNSGEIIGDKMYVSPMLFLGMSSNPFKVEKREYPIDFGYPTSYKYNINIEIPEGFTVESLPTNTNLGTDGQFGSFKYIIGQIGNKIQISVVTDINAAIVSAEYYDVIKEFFQKMVDKQNEKIVLKKA